MLGRRHAPLLVALGVVALAATGCADQSAVARVGDQTLSEAQLLDEVRALAENEQLADQAEQNGTSLRGDSDASFSQQLVGTVLTEHVQFMLIGELFADEGLELDDQARQAGEQQYAEFYGGAADIFPDSFRDDAVEGFAQVSLLQEQLGDGFVDAFTDVIESTEVQLSSRYGTWDRQAYIDIVLGTGGQDGGPAVVPPLGPLVAEAEAEADDGDDTEAGEPAPSDG